MSSFGIYCPSYNRADTCNTQNVVNNVTFVVRKSQYEDYKKNGINNLLAVEDNLIDSAMKVNEYLAKNAKEDVICILDDDIKTFLYRLDTNVEITDKTVIEDELIRIAQIMIDLDIGYGCVEATSIPYNYVSEFAWKSSSGSTRWINRKKFKAVFDKKCEYNWDIDVMMQELLINRICLVPKYLVSCGETDLNKGGSSSKKRQDQLDSISNMKYKWGKCFEYDYKHNKPRINVKR